ncbi:hypothetical protein [Methylobacter luteus]|uniref:hypothetical protein n=1 Tax=Methylobacter luteus TaxID=415 RepID=UPI00040BC2F1|nr:hypothetical protein [Methylobacter luteus]
MNEVKTRNSCLSDAHSDNPESYNIIEAIDETGAVFLKKYMLTFYHELIIAIYT